MKIATLALIFNDTGELLLGEKKRGEIGTGYLSGPGGKWEPGETLEAGVIRETKEELEIDLDPDSLKKIAVIDFYAAGELDFRVHVYRARVASGELHETADMIPGWYPLTEATFERTYEADRHWLPRAARGESFNARAYYKSRARDFDRIEFLPFDPSW